MQTAPLLVFVTGFILASQSVFANEFVNVEITAKRQFSAPPFVDGKFVPPASTVAKIPKEIKVSSGDAGVGQAILSIDDIECVYQGDGWKPRAPSSFYRFVSCKRNVSGLLAFLLNLVSRKFLSGQEVPLNKAVVLRVVSGKGPKPIVATAIVPVKQSAPVKVLIVDSPADGANLEKASFTITGRIGGSRALNDLSLQINDVYKVEIGADRTFSHDLLAADGTALSPA